MSTCCQNLAQWARGMILLSGRRGREFNSPLAPFPASIVSVTATAKLLAFAAKSRPASPRAGSRPPGWWDHRVKASIAQMVERKTLNLVVVGSIPTEGVFFLTNAKLSPPTVASSSA